MLDRNIISNDLIWLFSLNESVQSTRIEGTQTTFDEVMEADITQKFNLDTLEVKNYIDALTKGEILLRIIPISTRMILELHREILRDGRGKKLGEYMSNLEKYINDDFKDDIDPLIKIAVIHAQFESIHPFLDGNVELEEF